MSVFQIVRKKPIIMRTNVIVPAWKTNILHMILHTINVTIVTVIVRAVLARLIRIVQNAKKITIIINTLMKIKDIAH